MMHYTHSRRAFIQGSVGALALSALAACSSEDSKGSESNKPAAEEGDFTGCLLYTSDAADDSLRVDLGGRRIIKKKKN